MPHKVSKKLLLSVCFGFFAAASAHAQTVWHVDAAAPPLGDGTSWATAFNDLQVGIDAATPNNSPELDQIWVRAGTYKPTSQTDSFQLEAGVEVYGGFPTTGDPGFGDRNPDPETNGTILSGDIGQDDNPDGTIVGDKCIHHRQRSAGRSLACPARRLHCQGRNDHRD